MDSPVTAPDRIQWQRTSVQLCVLLIIIAFVVPRLALLAAASDGMSLSGDSKWYFDRAVSIVHGDGYAFDGKPTAFWPVGYPGFLALLFFAFPESLQTALIANFCLSAVTLVCSFRIFQELQLAGGWAMLGTFILALFPNFIFYGNLVLSESLMMALLSGSILLLLLAKRNHQFVLAGILFGLATLVKSQVLFLPVFGFVFDIWNQRSRKMAIIGQYLLLAIGMSAMVLPWTLRNYVVFDRFILVQSNGGYNLLMGYNETSRWGGSVGASSELAARFPGVAEDINRRLVDEMGMNDRASSVAWRFISEHPIEVLKSIPYKLYRFFRHDPQGIGSLVRSNADGGGLVWLPLLFQPSYWYYTTVLVLAALSSVLFIAGPLRTRAHFILLSAIFYFALISAVFFGEGRFHIPLLPALVGCMLVTLHAVEARLHPSQTTANYR